MTVHSCNMLKRCNATGIWFNTKCNKQTHYYLTLVHVHNACVCFSAKLLFQSQFWVEAVVLKVPVNTGRRLFVYGIQIIWDYPSLLWKCSKRSNRTTLPNIFYNQLFGNSCGILVHNEDGEKEQDFEQKTLEFLSFSLQTSKAFLFFPGSKSKHPYIVWALLLKWHKNHLLQWH